MLALQEDLAERIVDDRRARRGDRHLRRGDRRQLHRPDAVDDRVDVPGARRRDGGRRHAPGGRDHPGRARPVAGRRAHRARTWSRGSAILRRARADATCSGTSRRRDAVDGRRPERPTTCSEPSTIPIDTDDDVVRVRQLVRAARSAAKLSLVDQTKLVTAASELARNTLVYGGGGQARGRDRAATGGERGVRRRVPDEGPGIADVDAGADRRLDTGSGLGLGPRRRPPARRRVRAGHRGRHGHDGHGDQVDAMTAGPAGPRTSPGSGSTSPARSARRRRAPSSSPSGSASASAPDRRGRRSRSPRSRTNLATHAADGVAAAAAVRHEAGARWSSSRGQRPGHRRRRRRPRRTAARPRARSGIGLGAIDRLADALRDATRVPEPRHRRWSRRFRTATAGAVGARRPRRSAGITRPIPARRSAATPTPRAQDRAADSADALRRLGHGPLAARASPGGRARCSAACRRPTPPASLRRPPRGAAGTRGGAVAVARLDPAARRCGSPASATSPAAVVAGDAAAALISLAGHRRPPACRDVRAFEYDLPAGSAGRAALRRPADAVDLGRPARPARADPLAGRGDPAAGRRRAPGRRLRRRRRGRPMSAPASDRARAARLQIARRAGRVRRAPTRPRRRRGSRAGQPGSGPCRHRAERGRP